MIISDARVFLNPWRRTSDALSDLQVATKSKPKVPLQGAIEAKIAAHRSGRFSADRVDALFSADPEYDILREIAAHGARINVPPDVILDREPTPFREKQLQTPLTVQKHAWVARHDLQLVFALDFGKDRLVVLQSDLDKP